MNGSASAASEDIYRPAKKLKAALQPNLFAKFSALAVKHKAANLGQGFPSFGAPIFLQDAVKNAIAADVFTAVGAPDGLGSQYTRPGGEPSLVQEIARVYSPRFGRKIDPMTEVVTTVGAQEGIFTTLFAWTDPGDEVLFLTPCFDAGLKTCVTVGAEPRGVSLRPPSNFEGKYSSTSEWSLDLKALDAAITPRTRILMLTTPSAPLGKVYTRDELAGIADVVKRHPRLLVISDEVYERCVYSPAEHIHFASLPGMYERTMTLFSAGKTFSCTGWRVGYVIAPPQLAGPLIASHAAMNFCVATPFQKAIGTAFIVAEKEGYFQWLPEMMQKKRDELIDVLQEVGFHTIIPQGGYFVICEASVALKAAGIDPDDPSITPDTPLDDRPDVRVCEWLTENVGVTMIPVSPFYLPEDRHHANRLIRFAFCKDEATLRLAQERLRSWHCK